MREVGRVGREGYETSARLKSGVARASVFATILLAGGCFSPGQEEKAWVHPNPKVMSMSVPTGDAPASGGSAVGPGPAPVQDASEAYFQAAPACGRFEPNGLLDIEAGCAGNLCLSMTYEEAVQAAGGPKQCDTSDKAARCKWQQGISLSFPDLNSDGVPDHGLEAESLYLLDPSFRGTTKTGLGIGVSMRCFYETYGVPYKLDVQPTYTFASYFDSGSFSFYVEDSTVATGAVPDGVVDSIGIFSNPRGARIPCRQSTDCPLSRPKCAITDTSLGTLPVCMPLLASKQLGEPCTRPTEQRGVDDCGIGLFCSTLAGASNARCGKICDGTLESCGKEEACLFQGSSSLGSCLPRCDIFAAKDGCPTGSSCKNVRLLHGEAQLCMQDGAQAVGQSCAKQQDCGARLTCSSDSGGSLVCWERCNDAHPCAVGYCSAPDIDGGLGYCVH